MTKPSPPRKPVPPLWAPLVADFVRSLSNAHRPPTTIETRRSQISQLARALNPDPVAVTEDDLLDWFAEQTHWAKETHRGYRNAAVSFFRWAHDAGRTATNPAGKLPIISADNPISRPTPERIWRAAKMAADPRVMLMLRLAAEAGLRRGEVARVHVRDLRDDFDGPRLLVHGKGNRERIVPITDDLADAITAGAAGHTPGANRAGWLFPGRDGGHLEARWVGALCSRAIPDEWTMHTLRHRFATNAYRSSRNLIAVQRLLGHASVATTQRYLGIDDSEMRAAMLAAARAS